MFSYKRKDIESIYNQLIRSACINYEKHNLKESLFDIETAAFWAYSFNHIYMDVQIENLLRNISDILFSKVIINNTNKRKIVFIDSLCTDNRALTQQYIRAILAAGIELLYICTADDISRGGDIIDELNSSNKAKIVLVGGRTQIDKAEICIDSIRTFIPSHILLHINPWETASLLACYAIQGCDIYNINLTDHAFWLGASIIDYNIEFRPYGMTVSKEKRNLRDNQLLSLPYYSIAPNKTIFYGLPSIPSDAIVILTGGMLYKMLGKNDIFFRIMDAILGLSPKVYIIVAGFSPDKLFDEKCERMQYGERVIQIGSRKDIDSVFNHCDIYLGTYPMTGGLMVQYAAKHGKPVLAYRDPGDVMNSTEEILNIYHSYHQSFTSIPEMLEYAQKLIFDKNFRQSEGELLKKGIMDENKFNEAFCKVILSHEGLWEWKRDEIDYESFFERYLELENRNTFLATKHIIKTRGLGMLYKIKGYKIQFLLSIMYGIKKELFRFYLSLRKR